MKKRYITALLTCILLLGTACSDDIYVDDGSNSNEILLDGSEEITKAFTAKASNFHIELDSVYEQWEELIDLKTEVEYDSGYIHKADNEYELIYGPFQPFGGGDMYICVDLDVSDSYMFTSDFFNQNNIVEINENSSINETEIIEEVTQIKTTLGIEEDYTFDFYYVPESSENEEAVCSVAMLTVNDIEFTQALYTPFWPFKIEAIHTEDGLVNFDFRSPIDVYDIQEVDIEFTKQEAIEKFEKAFADSTLYQIKLVAYPTATGPEEIGDKIINCGWEFAFKPNNRLNRVTQTVVYDVVTGRTKKGEFVNEYLLPIEETDEWSF